MALSRELSRRLDSGEEPLPKRLKLAENAFRSVDLPIIRKEDIVSEWLCEVSREDPSAWVVLKSCLESADAHVAAVLKPKVKETLVNALRAALDENTATPDTLNCCIRIFSDPGMLRYFESKPELFASLLKAVLDFSSKRLHAEEAPRTTTCVARELSRDCASSAMEGTMQVYRQLLDKDPFVSVFLDTLLVPLCSLVDHNNTRDASGLGLQIHKCIRLLLFGRARHSQYKGYRHSPDEQEKSAGLPAKLFSTLARYSEGVTRRESVVATFSCVFRAAVDSCKSDVATIDLMFRNLVDSAGKFANPVLGALLDRAKNVRLPFDNAVEGVTLTHFLRNFVERVLSDDGSSLADLRVIRVIADANPLVVEHKLADVLRKVLARRGETQVERDSYEDLLIGVLEVSARLRREEKLVPWILTGLAQTDRRRARIRDVFPKSFRDGFAKLVGNMTSSQAVSTLRSLTFHLKANRVDPASRGTTLRIEAVVELFVAYSNGVRMYENSTSSASREKFVAALGEASRALSTLTEEALNVKHDKRIIVALLSATLSWTEMQSFLALYAPASSASTLTFPISDDQWQQLTQRITNFGESSCKNSMADFHRQFLWESDINWKSLRGTNRNSFDSLCIRDNRLGFIEIPCSFRIGIVCFQNELLLYRSKLLMTVNDRLSKVTANLIGSLDCFWPLLLEKYPEAIRLLGIERIVELAMLLQNDMTASDESFDKWANVLERDCLQENRNFVTALLCVTIVQIGRLVASSATRKITERIDVADIANAEEAGDENILGILKGAKKELFRKPWKKFEANLADDVARHLRILSRLPLPHLAPNLKSLTFLVVYCVGRECDESEAVLESVNAVLLDILEEGDITIFSYVDPETLSRDSAGNKVLSSVLERARPKLPSERSAASASEGMTAAAEERPSGRVLDGLENEDARDLTSALRAAAVDELNEARRREATRNLLEIALKFPVPGRSWPELLKSLENIAGSKRAHVSQTDVDAIMRLAVKSLAEEKLSVCSSVLRLCSTLLKSRTALIVDRLPVLLLLYRHVVKLIVSEARKTDDARNLRSLILDAEKLTSALVKLKRDVIRLSPYVIADLVGLLSEGALPQDVKGPLENSIGHLTSICDQHGVALLARTLPSATQEIFSALYRTYDKFYRFTGKI